MLHPHNRAGFHHRVRFSVNSALLKWNKSPSDTKELYSTLHLGLQKMQRCEKGTSRPPHLLPTVPIRMISMWSLIIPLEFRWNPSSSSSSSRKRWRRSRSCWRQQSSLRAPLCRGPGPLYWPTCASTRPWLSVLMSVIEPIFTDVCPTTSFCFCSPQLFADVAERTQPANQTSQTVGLLCEWVDYLDLSRLSFTGLFHRCSCVRGQLVGNNRLRSTFTHPNIVLTSPHDCSGPQFFRCRVPKRVHVDRLCRVCAAKCSFQLPCSVWHVSSAIVLPFQVSVGI